MSVMRAVVVAFTTALLYLLPIATFAQEVHRDTEIKAAIAKLSANPRGMDQFEILYKNPRRSTELLIASLHPVPRGRYQSGRHPQAVWIIRALRSLTGLNFRAHTRDHLTDNEAHFLDLDARTGGVNFFGTWMSRDRVWVAPLDAQTTIIGKWREWFEKKGKTFTYVNDRNFDNWYF